MQSGGRWKGWTGELFLLIRVVEFGVVGCALCGLRDLVFLVSWGVVELM